MITYLPHYHYHKYFFLKLQTLNVKTLLFISVLCRKRHRGCSHEIFSLAEISIFSVHCPSPIELILLTCKLFTWIIPKWNSLQVLLHCVHLQKWNFLSGDKCYVNTTPKWNYTKKNICACEYLIKTKDSRSKDQDKSQFHFISWAMKANVNRIFFHGKTKFRLGYIISDLM